MELNVDVLRPCMMYLVLCQIDSTNDITIGLQQILINPQVIKQLLKSNYLLHNLCHGHILGLHSRQYNKRL